MKRRINKIRLRDALVIFLGSTLMAFAVKYIFDPAELVTGGVSGLTIIIKDLSGRFLGYPIPLWVSNVVLNVPIFLFAIKTDGIRAVLRTGLSWIIMSVELAVFPEWNFLPDNLLLVSLYGGICFGVATGMLLSVRTTSGGTDMLGNSLHKYFPQYSMGRTIQVLDGIIVVMGAVVFDIEHTLFAIISVYVMGRLTDKVLDWGKTAKMAFIISEKNEEIAHEIMTELDRGVTALHGKGMYKGEERDILFCICSKRDIVDIKEIVRDHDKNAFFIIGSASEVLGEGFIENWT